MKTDFCIACSATENLHHHHLKPRAYGGTNDNRNLITLCIECHGVIHDRRTFSMAALTKNALNKRKQEGKKYSSIPFGFKDINGFLEEIPEEMAVVANVMYMRRQGMPLTDIAVSLNFQGVIGKNGGKWYASTIRYMILRQPKASNNLCISLEEETLMAKKYTELTNGWSPEKKKASAEKAKKMKAKIDRANEVVRLNANVKIDLHIRIKIEAARRGVTIGALIEELIEQNIPK